MSREGSVDKLPVGKLNGAPVSTAISSKVKPASDQGVAIPSKERETISSIREPIIRDHRYTARSFES
jgi:hypothetical protein